MSDSGSPIEMCVRNLFARATILLVNAAARVQRLQGRLLGNEVGDGLECFEHYGFTSNPLPGLEAAVLFVGGSRDHGVVVGVADRQFRIKALKPGEVALYTDEGDSIIFHRERHLDVTTVHLKADATEDATVNTKVLTANASEQVTVNTKSYTVNASEGVRFNTPSWTLGSVGGGCKASMAADIDLTGDLAQTGAQTTTGDQVAGGISQTGHTHIGCQGGSTGGPQ